MDTNHQAILNELRAANAKRLAEISGPGGLLPINGVSITSDNKPSRR
jgi:hypothetical protein